MGGVAPTLGRIASPPNRPRTPQSIPISIPPEALMRVSFIRPGNMAQAIASHLPTLQQFAREVIPALRETAAAERGGSTTGKRP